MVDVGGSKQFQQLNIDYSDWPLSVQNSSHKSKFQNLLCFSWLHLGIKEQVGERKVLW